MTTIWNGAGSEILFALIALAAAGLIVLVYYAILFICAPARALEFETFAKDGFAAISKTRTAWAVLALIAGLVLGDTRRGQIDAGLIRQADAAVISASAAIAMIRSAMAFQNQILGFMARPAIEIAAPEPEAVILPQPSPRAARKAMTAKPRAMRPAGVRRVIPRYLPPARFKIQPTGGLHVAAQSPRSVSPQSHWRRE